MNPHTHARRVSSPAGRPRRRPADRPALRRVRRDRSSTSPATAAGSSPASPSACSPASSTPPPAPARHRRAQPRRLDAGPLAAGHRRRTWPALARPGATGPAPSRSSRGPAGDRADATARPRPATSTSALAAAAAPGCLRRSPPTALARRLGLSGAAIVTRRRQRPDRPPGRRVGHPPRRSTRWWCGAGPGSTRPPTPCGRPPLRASRRAAP